MTAAAAKAEAAREYERDGAWLRDAGKQLDAFDSALDAQNWDLLRDDLARPPLGKTRALVTNLASGSEAAARGKGLVKRLYELDSFVYAQQCEAHKDLRHASAFFPKEYIDVSATHALVRAARAEIDAILLELAG